MSSLLKTLIFDACAQIPSLRIQRILGAIVRFVWPGCRGA